MNKVIKNIPFIGGNTMTFEYDFFTKILNSNAECPLNLYWSYTNAIKTPGDINGNSLTGFQGQNNQGCLSAIGIKDGDTSSANYKTSDQSSAAGLIAQVMVELDLTPICNSLFGGDVTTMAAACKNIMTDVYAKGSGSNNGVKTNGVQIKRWYNTGTGHWDGAAAGINNTNNICSIYGEDERIDGTKLGFMRDNKFRLLIWASYPSNETIPSEVDIDYINIKVSFDRKPDIVGLIPITVPKTWSLLLKEFSPAWDNTDSTQRYLWQVASASGNSNYEIKWYNHKFVFINWDGGTAENLYTDELIFNKFQTLNLLLEQTPNGVCMWVLQNGGTTKKYLLNTSRNFAGDKQMSILQHTINSYQADAFLNSVVFLPDKNFTDDEAEGILRGITKGFENDELFDLSNVNLHPNAHIQNNSIILNATSEYQISSIVIPVLPNNQYTINFDTNANDIYIDFYEKYNNITLISHWAAGNATAGSHSFTFVTNSKTNNISINILNNTNTKTGTFIWSNFSLKLKM